jgi:putative transposase
VKKARALNLPQGSIVVADLGYTDNPWYGQLTAEKIFFVTRLKRDARYRLLARRPVSAGPGLVSEETIGLAGAKGRECPKTLRRLVYRDPETRKFTCPSPTSSAWRPGTSPTSPRSAGRSRSSSASFKQDLEIKAFTGNPENAGISHI